MQGRRREQGWCVFVSFSFKFEIWGGGGEVEADGWSRGGWSTHLTSPLSHAVTRHVRRCASR